MAGQATLSQVQALYVAYYGRPAEPDGLNFWANVVEANGGDINVIIKDFSNAPEYQQRFGSLDDTSLVNNLYLQMFGRSAEPSGLEFWVGLLKAGTQTLGDIAKTISSLASGIDLQVLNGRVELANAFTGKLAASPEALENYGTTRGIEIGRAYLDQVKESTVGNLPALIDKAADTVATLPPSDGGGAGGGGVTPPPAATFVAQIDSGVLHFTGTATGEIDVVRDSSAGNVVFTRDGIKSTVTLTQFTSATAVDIGNATVKLAAADAAAVNAINGTGKLIINNVTASTDLSNLASSLDVTAMLTTDRDLTIESGLGTVDHFIVSTGHTLTVTVEQSGLVKSGAYALADSATALLAGDVQTLTGASKLIVTGSPTIEQLNELTTANTVVVYSSVTGTSAQLIANTDGYVTDGTNVVVSDSISVSGLDAVKAAIGDGTVTASTIEDNIGNLISGGVVSGYISVGTNVIVTDPATVAQIQALDSQNGTGDVSGALIYDLQDSVFNILANPGVAENAHIVTLTSGTNLGDVTVAQLAGLLDMGNLQDGSGNLVDLTDLTYNLVDTPAALIASSANDYVANAVGVTASETASVSQAVALHTLKATAVYSITDSAASLATSVTASQPAIAAATELTATNNATAAQALSIHTNAGSIPAAKVHYNVFDTYDNIVNGANADGINAAHNVNANSANLTVSQANQVLAFGNDGLTTIYSVSDNAANINTFLSANPWNDDAHYTFNVIDSAGHILDQIDNGNLLFIAGNSLDPADHTVTKITVNSSFDIAGAQAFWDAVNPVVTALGKTTSDKTTYTISDSIANYITDENVTTPAKVSTWVADADTKTVTGSAQEINDAQNAGRKIFGDLDSSDHIIATGAAGNQTVYGSLGSDDLSGGDGNDYIDGGAGADTINGGTGYNTLLGGAGNDTIYAGQTNADTASGNLSPGIPSNTVTGGFGGDRIYGSDQKDVFVYTAATKADLALETGTNSSNRDYIYNFSQGDKIVFQSASADNVQFLGQGSGNASSVTPGAFGLSIRYDKLTTIGGWQDGATVEGTRVSIDVADSKGVFDNVPDATIILVGQNIDINVVGNSIVFGA